MTIFKSKKAPKKVIAHFNAHGGDRQNPDHFDVEVDIPEGYTFKTAAWNRPAQLLDPDGDVAKEYEWKLGYEIVYEFFY